MKEIVDKFKEKLRVEVRRQGKLEIAEENNLRREELPGKYTVKILFGWNDGKFKNEYLKKLKRNWTRYKLIFLKKKS